MRERERGIKRGVERGLKREVERGVERGVEKGVERGVGREVERWKRWNKTEYKVGDNASEWNTLSRNVRKDGNVYVYTMTSTLVKKHREFRRTRDCVF